MAFIRAFLVKDGGANLGNFYRDLIRFTTRVLMPASFVLALLMIQQGESQTIAPNITAHTVQGIDQMIALGPVASLETIKHMGTNGGGFFNANASHPFENPTAITNLVQMLLMIVLPNSVVLRFGEMIGNRRQGWVLYRWRCAASASIGHFVLSPSCRRFGASVGTNFVETSQISGVRSIIHFILFIGLLLLWFR
jgi:potassium-transporting ATPase potassium-binding subunit